MDKENGWKMKTNKVEFPEKADYIISSVFEQYERW